MKKVFLGLTAATILYAIYNVIIDIRDGVFDGLTIVGLLFLLLVKILHVAHSSRDDLGKYICFGYFGIIALQSISNIGMCLALLPVMGVTLPFFSYGGTALLCQLAEMGIVLSVSRQMPAPENG